MGDDAFYLCTSLSSVELFGALTHIPDRCFYGCESLTDLLLPDSLYSTGTAAFYLCSSLEEIRLPEGFVTLGDSSFSHCNGLKNFHLSPSLKVIGADAFSYCGNLEMPQLPEGLEQIGDEAFSECAAFVSVCLPDSITELGMGVFQNCHALTDVSLGSGIISIPAYAFSGCSSLISVSASSGLTDIHLNAFLKCTSLDHFLYGGTQKQWDAVDALQSRFPQNVTLHCSAAGIEVSRKETPAGSYLYCSICDRALTPLPQCPHANTELSDYFFFPVLWAEHHGIATGTDNTHFTPNASCTRGQIVTFLWRAAGCPEPLSKENPFTDITPEQYYYKAVLWAAENGITTGTDVDRFSPEETCTRGQAATFLWRFFGEPLSESTGNPFRDVPEKAYYYEAIRWAAENGIALGTGENLFSPEETCIRGQIVTFLYRAIA